MKVNMPDIKMPEIKIGIPKLKGSKSKKIKWGISGLGRFSEFSVIPTLMLLKKSTITSVYSRKMERADFISKKFDIKEAYDNYDEFLKSDIDAVYVGSANNMHYEQVIKAAKAGKHILCDKPIALTSAQAKEMVEVCKENNVYFAVDYVYRFHPMVVKAKELLNNDLIGKIVSINVNFNAHFAPDDNFRFVKEESGGGALRDIGTHMIDLLRFFGGEINNIQGVIDNVIYNSSVDDFSAGICRFENGGYGIFNVSFNTRKAFNRIEILGHSGSISIDNLISAKTQSAKLTILHEGEGKKSFKRRGNKLLGSLKSFQNCLLKKIEPSVTGYDGYVNLKLMEELEEKWLKQN